MQNELLLGDMLKAAYNCTPLRNTVREILIPQIIVWTIFALSGPRQQPLAGRTFELIALAAIGAVVLVWYTRNAMSRWDLVVVTVFFISLLIVSFAWLYWGYGTKGNFSRDLSKWDAVYFALGTFTTAGTGGLEAKTELAEALVSCQLVLDFVWVAGAVTLVVNKLGSK